MKERTWSIQCKRQPSTLSNCSSNSTEISLFLTVLDESDGIWQPSTQIILLMDAQNNSGKKILLANR